MDQQRLAEIVAEVTKDCLRQRDRMENEAMPSAKIDPQEVILNKRSLLAVFFNLHFEMLFHTQVDFGVVNFNEPKTRTVSVLNTGSVTKFSFLLFLLAGVAIASRHYWAPDWLLAACNNCRLHLFGYI